MHRSSYLPMTVAILAVFYGPAALAIDFVGAVRSLDGETKTYLVGALKAEKVLGQDAGIDDNDKISEAVAKYFSDNESSFFPTNSESENVDIVVCLLDKRGQSAGALMNGDMKRFCQEHLK